MVREDNAAVQTYRSIFSGNKFNASVLAAVMQDAMRAVCDEID